MFDLVDKQTGQAGMIDLNQLLQQLSGQPQPQSKFANPISAGLATMAAAFSNRGAQMIQDMAKADELAKQNWIKQQLAVGQLANQIKSRQADEAYKRGYLDIQGKQLALDTKRFDLDKVLKERKLKLDEASTKAQVNKWKKDAELTEYQIKSYQQALAQNAWTPKQSISLAVNYSRLTGIPIEDAFNYAQNKDTRLKMLDDMRELVKARRSTAAAAKAARMKFLHQQAMEAIKNKYNMMNAATAASLDKDNNKGILGKIKDLFGDDKDSTADPLQKAFKYYRDTAKATASEADRLYRELTSGAPGGRPGYGAPPPFVPRQNAVEGQAKVQVQAGVGLPIESRTELQVPGKIRRSAARGSSLDLIRGMSDLDIAMGNVGAAYEKSGMPNLDKAFTAGVLSSVGIDVDDPVDIKTQNTGYQIAKTIGEITGSFLGLAGLGAAGLKSGLTLGIGMLGPEVIRSITKGEFSKDIDDIFVAFTSAQLGSAVGPKVVDLLVKVLGKTKAGKAIKFGSKLGPKLLGGLKVASGGLLTYKLSELMGLSDEDIIEKSTPAFLFLITSKPLRSAITKTLERSAKLRFAVNPNDKKAAELLSTARKVDKLGEWTVKVVSKDPQAAEKVLAKVTKLKGKPPKIAGLAKDEQEFIRRYAAEEAKPYLGKVEQRIPTTGDAGQTGLEKLKGRLSSKQAEGGSVKKWVKRPGYYQSVEGLKPTKGRPATQLKKLGRPENVQLRKYEPPKPPPEPYRPDPDKVREIERIRQELEKSGRKVSGSLSGKKRVVPWVYFRN